MSVWFYIFARKAFLVMVVLWNNSPFIQQRCWSIVKQLGVNEKYNSWKTVLTFFQNQATAPRENVVATR